MAFLIGEDMEDKYLAIVKLRTDSDYRHLAQLHDAEQMESYQKQMRPGEELLGVPWSDVVALAGLHEETGPQRMITPFTVDHVALRIMAALYVQEDEMEPADCAEIAWSGAQAFMAEAMQRDAMGMPIKQETEDDAESK